MNLLLLAVCSALLRTSPSNWPSVPRDILQLCPVNSHYLQYRGKPTLLISSGEHYGAVLNLDFPQIHYLDTLKQDGLNLTRTFSGVYCEDSKSFNIRENTLAPAANRYVTPWARSETPGYANGGNRFDLTKWDEGYFSRLQGFVHEAGKRGIIVEMVLFCPFYEDSMWNLSPMNQRNNVNGIGTMPREEVYTLKHPEMVALLDRVAEKIVTSLRDAPNVYFEICNEPYFGGVALDWQMHMAETIRRAEEGRAYTHLIAQNIANEWAKVTAPSPLVSIFNFHYASPPRAVTENFVLNRPIAFDETGFKGNDDFTYRAQAWEFILAGGALFDNLDYSFTVAKPDGTAPVAPPTPGGGSPSLRRQLGFLKRFVERMDFTLMAPDMTSIRTVGAGVSAHVLSKPGSDYAIYLRGASPSALDIDLPAGRYSIEWLAPVDGTHARRESIDHPGGSIKLSPPPYREDMALRIHRR